jgi:hypothetical protein
MRGLGAGVVGFCARPPPFRGVDCLKARQTANTNSVSLTIDEAHLGDEVGSLGVGY